MKIKPDRLYIVTDGFGDVFACNRNDISSNNDKGAGFSFIKVDENGYLYLEDKIIDDNDKLSIKRR